jgi:hypothetical protein
MEQRAMTNVQIDRQDRENVARDGGKVRQLGIESLEEMNVIYCYVYTHASSSSLGCLATVHML